jgi:serine/threonine protein kinase
MVHLRHPGVVECITLESVSPDIFSRITGISLEGVKGLPVNIPAIVMEFVEGTPLDSMLSQEGRLPLVRALRIAIAEAKVLEEVNAKGIIHRDFKPGNVFIVDEKEDGPVIVKIGDFGLAKIVTLGKATSATKLTVQGAIMGTLEYMSSEQMYGGEVDWRTDLYAFGAALYETIAGQPPYGSVRIPDNKVPKREDYKDDGEYAAAYAAAFDAAIKDFIDEVIAAQSVPVIGKKVAIHDQQLANQLQTALSRMLAKDRDHRFKSWRDCIKTLEALLVMAKRSTAAMQQLQTDETVVGAQIVGDQVIKRPVKK